jgi:hypothetical protein
MKFIKILASLMLVMVCSAFTMGDEGKGVYMAGVSASFTDSLVHFTGVQFVDSVMLDKDGMLPYRDQYSDQLDSYLEYQQGLKNRICFIYFDVKKEKVEKAIKKMKAKYQKGGKSILREVDADFKFTKAEEY